MILSVVTTLYKSEKFIREFYNRIVAEIEKNNFSSYEIIFVDDGSPDNCKKIIFELQKINKNIKYILLSRNFGHHNAIFAGLENCSGKYIFLLDVDLEDKPEWLSLFFKKMKKENFDAVYGFQEKRSGSFFRKISGKIYYAIFTFFISFEHQKNITTARLMKREYLNAVLKFSEKLTIISGIFALAGFKQGAVKIKKDFKKYSSYTFFMRMSVFLSSLVSLTDKPLKIIVFLNFIISILVFIFSLFIFVNRLINEETMPGWTSLILIASVSWSFIALTMMIISLYIEQIYNEVKNRPRNLIKKND